MGAHFSKVAMFFVVYLLLAGSSETAVLPAWELNFREFACNFGWFFGNAEIVKKCGFPVFLFLYFEQGRGGKKRRQDSGADFWFIFETWSMFFGAQFLRICL